MQIFKESNLIITPLSLPTLTWWKFPFRLVQWVHNILSPIPVRPLSHGLPRVSLPEFSKSNVPDHHRMTCVKHSRLPVIYLIWFFFLFKLSRKKKTLGNSLLVCTLPPLCDEIMYAYIFYVLKTQLINNFSYRYYNCYILKYVVM